MGPLLEINSTANRPKERGTGQGGRQDRGGCTIVLLFFADMVRWILRLTVSQIGPG